MKVRFNGRFFSIGAVAVVLVGGGWLTFSKFRGNPHYDAGVKNITAGNFPEAASEFRLTLQEQPDNQNAKGLLAYSVVRTELEDLPSDEGEGMKPEALLLSRFLNGYMMFELEAGLKSFRDEDTRKRIQEAIKRYKDAARNEFKSKRIPFRDWQDFKESVALSAAELFRLRPNAENPADERARDIAAAVLAKGGDDEAKKYLLDRCANDSDLLPLTLVAGEAIKENLKTETSNRDSFIAEEGLAALRLLDLKPKILEFASLDPAFRPARKGDLPEGQKGLLEERPWTFFNDDEATIILKLDALKGQNVDPSSLNLLQVNSDDGTNFAILSAFSPNKAKFRCRALAWTANGYQQIALSSGAEKDLLTNLPVGTKAFYDEEAKQLRVAVDSFKKVKKTRSENDVRLVTRYRTESRYNPSANNGYGGYVDVEVPYEEYEPYTRNVDYEEPERGSTWRVYNWDSGSGTLTFSRSLWVQDSRSFEEVDQEQKERDGKGQTKKEIAQSTKPTDANKVDALIMAAMTRLLASSELEGLNSRELRMLRNGVFARKGYSFKDPELRRYFMARSWYRPMTSDMEAVASTFTADQRSNLDLIKAVEKGAG